MSEYENFDLVPPGMTPVGPENEEVKNDNAEETGNDQVEASTEEPTSEESTPEQTETGTEETQTEGTEQPKDEVKPVESQVDEDTSSNQPQTDDSQEEDSSLHSERFTAHDLISQYDDGLEEGEATFHELVQRKYRNLDELNPMDIIMEGMIYEDHEVSDAEIDLRIDKYDVLFLPEDKLQEKIDDGDITERQVKVLEAEMAADIRKYKRVLQNDQDSIDLEKIAFELPSRQDGGDQEKLNEETLKGIKDSFTDFLNDYDSETLKVVSKDGETIHEFNYELDQTTKDAVINAASNPQGIFSRWVSEDGQFNQQLFVSDFIKLQNWDKISKSLYDQGASSSTEEILKDTNNITDVKRTTSSGGTGDPTAHDFLSGIYER